MAIAPQVTTEPIPTADYARLEERIVARDQLGASQALYGLMKQGRPITEITRETVRIHAPYTNVPYHQRLDDGVVKFVNNDHCLLSERVEPAAAHDGPARAGLAADGADHLVHADRSRSLEPAPRQDARSLHPALRAHGGQGAAEAASPLARSGAACHRGPDPRAPEPLADAGAARRGAALPTACSSASCRTRPIRKTVLAHLAFAGLIDVQDRMLHNRSYTTGHKSYRARAAIELGNAIGWDNAHSVLYASVPDIAVGPRWYSTYEMGCNVVQNLLDGKDAELLRQDSPLTPAEEALALVDAITRQREVLGDRGGGGAAATAGRSRAGSRRDPGRGSPGHPRDGRAEQLLDVAARLRVLQHAARGSSTPSSTRTGSSSCSWPRPSSITAPSTSATRPTTGRARSRCRPAWRGSGRASCSIGSRRRPSRCVRTRRWT